MGIGALVIGALLATVAVPTPVRAADKPKAVPRAAAVRPAASQPAAPRPAEAYRIEPAPAWVVPAPDAPMPAELAPLTYKLLDEQVRIDAGSSVQYTRLVRWPREAGALAQAAQVEIEFDPSFQTVALHHLDVVRDGRRIGKIDRQRIQVLQRETQLERQMYDGRVTLSVVLDDVRVGDQVDLAYSVRGSNPVFGPRFVQQVVLGSFRGPVALARLRWLAPVGRTIHQRIGPADAEQTQTEQNGWRETVVRRVAVPQLRLDEGAPYSAMQQHLVQLSEFADWAEVARWGQALFSGDEAAPAVLAQADEIRAAAPGGRSDQVLAALRFVQQQVRYFGTEIGPSSHRPAPPAQVLAQRFGDCKDKVRLLIALLRQLGVDARPVLVSVYHRAGVSQLLPSPLAFDHVIARVELDGASYWLDATRGQQSGNLAARQTVTFRKGLELAADRPGLSDLPPLYDLERMSVRDTVQVQRFADAPVLESRITYRGDLADGVRDSLSTRSRPDLTAALAAPYVKLYPKLRSLGDWRVETSDSDDAVTVVQRFELPDFWRFPEQQSLNSDLMFWGPLDALVVPKVERRRDPLALNYPGVFRHEIAIEYPEDVYSQGSAQRFDEGDGGVTLQIQTDVGKRRAVYRAEVRLAVDHIEPGDWNAHVTRLGKMLPRLSFSVRVPALTLAQIDGLNQLYRSELESLRQGKLKLVSKAQVDAHMKALVLDAQIHSGRLAPPLEAQALLQRGIAFDHLGRWDEAGRDFARALTLTPDDAEVMAAAAENARARGRFDEAIEFSSRLLARQPRHGDALTTRAIAWYFKKDLAAARRDLEAALQDRGVARRGYPVVWLALALRAAGADAAGLDTTYLEPGSSDWPRPLIDMALGKSSPESVIEAAKAARSPADSLAEAYFYVAERYLAEGNLKRATEYWRKAVDQGRVEFVEHSASLVRLAAAGR